MDEISIKKLILAAPLAYRKDDSLQFPVCDTVRGEVLFRMALDPSQSRSIEPDRRAFPGRLVAAGVAADPREAEARLSPGGPGLLELPAGTYFFAQIREAPDMETLIDMIIEAQQEGLWERYSLDDSLYIRRLLEDGQRITQIFRPVRNPQIFG
ncbi:MAG: hypothetical protein LBP81_03615 [Treponema sp.]|jgi:hypothetical protein|nr:hypothetical protein [Treponema sp.]